MEVHQGYPKDEPKAKTTDNSRNGYSNKQLKSELGPVDIQIPRDRKGEFEPQIVPKYKRDITGIEEKVIALYSKGMLTRDIHHQIKDLYGIEISACQTLCIHRNNLFLYTGNILLMPLYNLRLKSALLILRDIDFHFATSGHTLTLTYELRIDFDFFPFLELVLSVRSYGS